MEKNSEIKHRVAKTYANDMAAVIENDKEGLVKKIIHEQEKHEEEKKNFSPESRKNKLFMFFSFLFVISAFALLFYFLFFRKEKEAVVAENQFTPIIFNDKSVFLEVSELKKEEIIQSVLGEINVTKVKVGGVEGIYLTENKKIIGLRRFFSLIKSNFIPGDNTIIVNDNFLMGTVKNDAEADFFILLKVNSIADIFNAFRAWEGKMFTDLYGFLGVNISADNNYLLTKEFKDGIVENKNARILYDKDDQIVLMYIFANDNFLLITDSQNATHEIILRLVSSKKKQ